eukprot:Sspe_Gene.31991::Locus_15711_Transcript_1_1_Confidence_1.000_Length_896::g.31991::m.31991/K01507/ppa; inorganic pyrophosphatase
MIDEGETDWKMIALPAKTPEFDNVRTLKDLQQHPSLNKRLADVIHWFRYYKTTDGKPENTFGFNSEYQDEQYCLKVIEEASDQYQQLLAGKTDPKKLWVKSA